MEDRDHIRKPLIERLCGFDWGSWKKFPNAVIGKPEFSRGRPPWMEAEGQVNAPATPAFPTSMWVRKCMEQFSATAEYAEKD
jgi:hypothetical protein